MTTRSHRRTDPTPEEVAAIRATPSDEDPRDIARRMGFTAATVYDVLGYRGKYNDGTRACNRPKSLLSAISVSSAREENRPMCPCCFQVVPYRRQSWLNAYEHRCPHGVPCAGMGKILGDNCNECAHDPRSRLHPQQAVCA